MRSMIVLSWNSSRPLARLSASISLGSTPCGITLLSSGVSALLTRAMFHGSNSSMRLIGCSAMRLEHLAQVRLGIEPVELGRLHQAVDRRGALAAGVRAHEEVVLAAQADAAQRAFGGVVVDLDAPVVDVARQRLPAREAVADGLRQLRLGRHAGEHAAEPGVQVLQQRPGACLRCSRRSSGGWPRMSASISYSSAMRCSACSATESSARARCSGTDPSRSSRVGPAGRFDDAAAVVQLASSRHRRRPAGCRCTCFRCSCGCSPLRSGEYWNHTAGGSVLAGGSIVAHVDPQPAGLGLARARGRAPSPACRRRAPCAGQRVAAQRGHQRVEQGVALVDPAGHRRAVDLARPRAHRCGSGGTAGVWSQYLATITCASSAGPGMPRAIGRLGAAAWKMRLAAHARELGAHMADDLEVRRHVFQLLGDVLADLAQPAAAVAAAAGLAGAVVMRAGRLGVVHLRLARQVLGQLALDVRRRWPPASRAPWRAAMFIQWCGLRSACACASSKLLAGAAELLAVASRAAAA